MYIVCNNINSHENTFRFGYKKEKQGKNYQPKASIRCKDVCTHYKGYILTSKLETFNVDFGSAYARGMYV